MLQLHAQMFSSVCCMSHHVRQRIVIANITYLRKCDFLLSDWSQSFAVKPTQYSFHRATVLSNLVLIALQTANRLQRNFGHCREIVLNLFVPRLFALATRSIWLCVCCQAVSICFVKFQSAVFNQLRQYSMVQIVLFFHECHVMQDNNEVPICLQHEVQQ